MNNTKRSEILSKIIERTYDKHPDMQSIIGSMLVNVCKEENVSAEKVFFAFFLFVIKHCSKKSRQ